MRQLSGDDRLERACPCIRRVGRTIVHPCGTSGTGWPDEQRHGGEDRLEFRRALRRLQSRRPRRYSYGQGMTARRIRLSGLLLGAALATWILVVQRMRGMDAGPGTDLGGLGWYLGVWVTMMAAMMLPSVAPMVLLFDKVSAERARRGRAVVPTWIFASSYFAVWTLYGLAAYGVYRVVRSLHLGFLDWDRGGPPALVARRG